MNRTWLTLGVTMCATACTSELQTVEIQNCTNLSLRDQVELVVSHAGPMALRVSEDVTLDIERGLTLGGSGQANLTCSEVTNVQTLGHSSLYVKRAPNLLSLRAYGQSEVAIDEIGTAMLEIRASGQAKIAIGMLDADQLELQGGGESQVAISGSTGDARLNLAGDAIVDAGALQTQNVSLSGPGTGAVSLWATAHLEISSDVVREADVKGTPDITDGREESR